MQISELQDNIESITFHFVYLQTPCFTAQKVILGASIAY